MPVPDGNDKNKTHRQDTEHPQQKIRHHAPVDDLPFICKIDEKIESNTKTAAFSPESIDIQPGRPVPKYCFWFVSCYGQLEIGLIPFPQERKFTDNVSQMKICFLILSGQKNAQDRREILPGPDQKTRLADDLVVYNRKPGKGSCVAHDVPFVGHGLHGVEYGIKAGLTVPPVQLFQCLVNGGLPLQVEFPAFQLVYFPYKIKLDHGQKRHAQEGKHDEGLRLHLIFLLKLTILCFGKRD